MSIGGPLAERLNEVKRYYQFENYTDLIRFLITHSYERVVDIEKLRLKKAT